MSPSQKSDKNGYPDLNEAKQDRDDEVQSPQTRQITAPGRMRTYGTMPTWLMITLTVLGALFILYAFHQFGVLSQ